MISKQKQKPIIFNTNTAGLTVLMKELKETRLFNLIDSKCPKNSGYLVSDIVTTSIIKNILNIPTYTETSEEIKELPEFDCKAYRTTLGRNIRRVGKLDDYNIFLSILVTDFVKKFKIKSNEIRIIVDGTTIEVSPNSKYEGVDWVWDNAQSKLVWGYEVTIVAIAFRDVYLPIHFEFGEMSKENLEIRFSIIRMFTGANIVLFDGGYACDSFYENLTKNNFKFYTKVPIDWWFNNGKNIQIKEMKKQPTYSKNKEFYTIKAFRVKNNKLTNIEYSLCFKKGDKRVLITNNLEEDIAETTFNEFFKRWDIETCNDELKDNFCFEKLPIRDKSGIIGYLLTCLLALNLMTIIKFKHRKKLKNVFNKGFKKIIRWLIKVKAKWNSYTKLNKLTFREKYMFKWFYEEYGLV